MEPNQIHTISLVLTKCGMNIRFDDGPVVGCVQFFRGMFIFYIFQKEKYSSNDILQRTSATRNKHLFTVVRERDDVRGREGASRVSVSEHDLSEK